MGDIRLELRRLGRLDRLRGGLSWLNVFALVIHPFPNGNGRWSRLVADLLLKCLGQAPFTYGNSELRTSDAMRTAYIAALRAADGQDFGPLIAFLRS
jgi:fido (protein-threonine AMPylation protein)